VLREAYEYLTTPCPPLARRYGYLAEMVALGARYRRQKTAWAPHLAACRRFVTDAMARVPKGGRAMVAGSGLLLEVPLRELAGHFGEVVLVDVIHTRAVRRAARQWPNVRLEALDVSGALEPLAAALAASRPLPIPTPPALPGERFAFAVSCNLLSQLPLMPLEAIERGAPAMPNAVRGAFAHSLARDHLAWLARSAEKSALFTDTESLWLEGERVIEREDSLWGLVPPAPDRSWTWVIAPAPEEDRKRDLHHTVGGWFDVMGFAASC